MYVSEVCAEGIFVTFPWWLKNVKSRSKIAFLKVDLELPTDWHVPILCIIFPRENPQCREKRYVEYRNVLLNLFSQCNLWRNITFNDNRFFILRNKPVLQLGIFLHNRYALLLRMETLATEKVEIVSEKLKVCKRDKLLSMVWGMGIFDRFRTDCVYWKQCIVYGIELRALPSSTTPMSQRLLSQRDGSGPSPLAVME